MDSAAMNIFVCLLMHEHTFLLEICLRVTLLSHRLLMDVSFPPTPFLDLSFAFTKPVWKIEI